MLRGRPVRGDVSLYLESLVCQRWGCTPSALAKEDAARVLVEIEFIREERRAESANR